MCEKNAFGGVVGGDTARYDDAGAALGGAQGERGFGEQRVGVELAHG